MSTRATIIAASAAERTGHGVRSAALGAMLVAILLMQGQDRAFIYFQF